MSIMLPLTGGVTHFYFSLPPSSSLGWLVVLKSYFLSLQKSESCFFFNNLFFLGGGGGKFQQRKNKSFNVQYQRVISSIKDLIFTKQNQQIQFILFCLFPLNFSAAFFRKWLVGHCIACAARCPPKFFQPE